jgi:hypothetical protein
MVGEQVVESPMAWRSGNVLSLLGQYVIVAVIVSAITFMLFNLTNTSHIRLDQFNQERLKVPCLLVIWPIALLHLLSDGWYG